MLAQAVAELPNECCGLLAGRTTQTADDATVFCHGQVLRRYPLVNAAASPVEYLSDAQSMFDAVRDMRRLGLEVLAVYHSHPTSDPIPSRTDLERHYSSEVVHFIISLKTGQPEIRAWWLTDANFREADWDLVEEEAR
jgi:proteasome lid subunit RPN8/RPN11